jgi:dCMP deaminase
MKREDYISWEEYFMGVAELSARRSKDPKTQVGACIINPDNKHILSIGYNGLPRGMNDDDISWEDESDFLKSKHTYVVHAEANAILNANTNIGGSSMYVTMFPCNECAKLIVQSGVKELVYKDDKFLHKPQGIASAHILAQGGVTIKKYEEEDI